MFKRHYFLGLLAIPLLAAIPSVASAALTTEPVTTDAWDVAQGVVVTGHSALKPAPESPIEHMFGGGDSVTSLAKFSGNGWVEWQTPTPIKIDNFSIYSDPRPTNHHGEFSSFTLYYRNADDTNWEVLYQSGQYNGYPGLDHNLIVATHVTQATATTKYRATFFENTADVRVIELDGFAVPEPGTGMLALLGLSALVMLPRRRKVTSW